MLSNFIQDIIQKKTGKLLDLPENVLQFNPYIIQRFLSMLSGNMCHILNETTNKKLNSFEKKEIYQLLITLIPQQKKSYIKYIKKETEKSMFTDIEKKGIDLVAEKYKISKKSIEQYINDLNLNIDKYTKGLD